jgi:hypothetical protein
MLKHSAIPRHVRTVRALKQEKYEYHYTLNGTTHTHILHDSTASKCTACR